MAGKPALGETRAEGYRRAGQEINEESGMKRGGAMIKNPYEVRQLDASCWQIEESGVRSFLITGDKRALLVDSGYGTGNIKEIAGQLTALPLMLVNTHTDRDHIGCNALFEKAYMHPAEYDRYHLGTGAGPAVEPLWEGDRINLGGRSFEVILIPGHTPGSIALLDAENRVLLGGDSVQAGMIFMFGQGRNIHAYIASMLKLAGIRDRFDTVYPSHGPIPVSSDILDGLIHGARRILSKEIEGTESPIANISAKVYDAGVAKFLYE
jgi:hydroxyacylglutathione hydrolase